MADPVVITENDSAVARLTYSDDAVTIETANKDSFTRVKNALVAGRNLLLIDNSNELFERSETIKDKLLLGYTGNINQVMSVLLNVQLISQDTYDEYHAHFPSSTNSPT